jgi:hypothetical protein
MVDATLAVPLARERALAILRRLLHRVCYFCFCTGGVGFWSGDRTCHWPIRENLMDAREDALSSVGAKSL